MNDKINNSLFGRIALCYKFHITWAAIKAEAMEIFEVWKAAIILLIIMPLSIGAFIYDFTFGPLVIALTANQEKLEEIRESRKHIKDDR